MFTVVSLTLRGPMAPVPWAGSPLHTVAQSQFAQSPGLAAPPAPPSALSTVNPWGFRSCQPTPPRPLCLPRAHSTNC